MKGLRLQTKLFIVYALIIVLILGGVLTFFYIYLSSILKDRYLQNLEQIAIKSSQQIDSLVHELDQIALYSATNPTIKSFFMLDSQASMNFKHKDLVNETLMAIALPSDTPYIRTSLFNAKGQYISIGIPDNPNATTLRMQSAEFQTWYTQLASSTRKYLLTPPHVDYWSTSYKQPMISFSRVMRDVNTYATYGIVEVQLPFYVLEETLNLDKMSGLNTLVYDQEGHGIYPLSDPDDTLIPFYQKKIGNSLSNNLTIVNPNTHEKEIVFYVHSEFSGWTLVMTQKMSELLSPVYFMSKVLLFTGLCLILVLLVAVYFVSRKMTEPLITLRNSVRTITYDNLSLEIGETSTLNEVKELDVAFNKMFTQLKQSMDEVVLAKTHEMKAHMIALQSQMDPHFLYNILSIISAMSREQEDSEIAHICSKLSGMLRYISVYNEESVSFSDEINHVTNYLSLMQIRFEDQLHYSIEITEELKAMPLNIPKLLFQPLVENCFQHGFKKTAPPWVIKLSAYTEAGYWKVDIFDNGVGIKDEQIQALYQQAHLFLTDPSKSIKDLTLGGMGLINTLVRLKLFYKESMIFKVESGDYGNTKITIGGRLE